MEKPFDTENSRALHQLIRLTDYKKAVVLFASSRGRVKTYGKLSPKFTTSSSTGQGIPLSHILFNFVIDTIMEGSLTVSNPCGVEMLTGHLLTDTKYAEDIVLLGSDIVRIQILSNLNNPASWFGDHLGASQASPVTIRTLLASHKEPADLVKNRRVLVVPPLIVHGHLITVTKLDLAEVERFVCRRDPPSYTYQRPPGGQYPSFEQAPVFSEVSSAQKQSGQDTTAAGVIRGSLFQPKTTTQLSLSSATSAY
ncbi:hypothetical protein CLF_103978 [Clonorchis sinensis]|uniref:Reverse transcriptase domain-containing protein n=1 Tax=Clonorchis sinensis TaxID=79923 RepID=G7YNP5_CLOSI|nr:hypothetical protein CLF_103978 [Clonorchis sinensis]